MPVCEQPGGRTDLQALVVGGGQEGRLLLAARPLQVVLPPGLHRTRGPLGHGCCMLARLMCSIKGTRPLP